MREFGRSAGSQIRKSHYWKHIPYGNNSIRAKVNANLPSQTFLLPIFNIFYVFFSNVTVLKDKYRKLRRISRLFKPNKMPKKS